MKRKLITFALLYVLVSIINGCESQEKKIEKLTTQLTDKNDAVRRAAVVQLGKTSDPSTIPILIRALEDDSKYVRQSAATALGWMGEHAAVAVPTLAETMGDLDWNVRNSAVEALGRIGEPAKLAVPELMQALADREWLVRSHAAEALGNIGAPSAEVAVPSLARTLRDEHSIVRSRAVEALGKIARPTELTVPALISALSDNYSLVRSDAVDALVMIGEPAVPTLTEALNGQTWRVRSHAAEALSRINAPTVRALAKVLDDENLNDHAEVAEVLGESEHASITTPEHIVTCEAIDNLEPTGISEGFKPGRVYAWARVNAPTSEKLTFKWFNQDSRIIREESVNVERDQHDGYRIYDYMSFGTGMLNTYHVRLYNSLGTQIGSRAFTVSKDGSTHDK